MSGAVLGLAKFIENFGKKEDEKSPVGTAKDRWDSRSSQEAKTFERMKAPDPDANGIPAPPARDTENDIEIDAEVSAEVSAEVDEEEGAKESPEKKRETLIEASKLALEKRKNRLRLEARQKNLPEETPAPRELIGNDIRSIPVSDIKEDPTFHNTRLYDDAFRPELPSNEGQKLEDLRASMVAEGQKVPIVVVEGPGQTFFLRAGWRRHKTAMELGWKTIKALVLPSAKITDIDEYWFNILENTVRKSLTSYEVACAAKLMRDKFGIGCNEFARRAGYSSGHVSKLLSCIDKLPPLLVDQWKAGAGCSLAEWYTLSLLDYEQALETFRKWMGLRAKDLLRRSDEPEKNDQGRLAPAWFIDRMQRLYIGLEGSELAPRTRDLCLKVVEYCQGSRDSIPDVYEPRKQAQYKRKARLRQELAMPELPEPGEEKEMPEPKDEERR